MRDRQRPVCLALLVIALAGGPGQAGDRLPARPALGRVAPPDVIRRMDISVMADGTGLPAGSGSAAAGRATYAAKCEACHGPEGGGGVADRLTGGSRGAAPSSRTIARYWPYAPTLFDYIRRAMPLTAPQSLEDGEVYGLVAYLLAIDGIVAADRRLDGPGLARIAMPNRAGFVSLEPQRFDGNVERVTRR